MTHSKPGDVPTHREPLAVDEYDIHSREPEALNVWQLNRVVRALREALYQEKLRSQAHAPAAAPEPITMLHCSQCGEGFPLSILLGKHVASAHAPAPSVQQCEGECGNADLHRMPEPAAQDRLRALFRGAHYVNIVVRRGGKDETHEGDWLREFLK